MDTLYVSIKRHYHALYIVSKISQSGFQTSEEKDERTERKERLFPPQFFPCVLGGVPSPGASWTYFFFATAPTATGMRRSAAAIFASGSPSTEQPPPPLRSSGDGDGAGVGEGSGALPYSCAPMSYPAKAANVRREDGESESECVSKASSRGVRRSRSIPTSLRAIIPHPPSITFGMR